MKYTVKLTPAAGGKSITYNNIVGDLPGKPEEGMGGVRILILDDNTRVEVPGTQYLITFSPDRFKILHKNMQREAGQPIPVESQQ